MIDVHMYICIYVYMYICKNIYMYINMYVCIYIYIHMYSHPKVDRISGVSRKVHKTP